MASGLNQVMLLGNLGADPELRVLPSGQALLNLRLATNESYLDRNQVRQERVEWHRITVWGRRAEALAKILRKGAKLFVEGRLQTSTYEKNGEKRYSTSIVAINVILPSSEGGGGGGGGGGSRRPSSAPSESAAPSDAQEGDDLPYGGGGGGDDIPF